MTTNLPDRFRGPLLAAGIFGVTGVALGALGAHALAAVLEERGMMRAWETAARYQLFHTTALLGVAGWLRGYPATAGVAAVRMLWAARWWNVGILLFSGSLYGLALGGPHWLGPVTPLGGLAFMTGWLCVIGAALKKPELSS
ncbi:MAG: DUF423 domain-containing protein [Opitutus sp.]|nr:DUF423 domain-containing protein [Opitutus sp.]